MQSLLAKPVPSQAEGNALFPLPPDYYELSEDGARLARVNACRQWLLYENEPLRKAAALCSSFDFFDRYYLRRETTPEGEIRFDPLFYDCPVVPRAPMHWEFIKATSLYRLVACCLPRGSSKSTLCAIAVMLEMLTLPGMSFIYTTSSATLSKGVGERIKYQLYFNQRITEDFGPLPEFDGRIQPRKAEGVQASEFFTLRNRARFQTFSVDSRQRGIRPLCYILDDPEYDPDSPERADILADHLQRRLKTVIMPMLSTGYRRIWYPGTIISGRHFMSRIFETEEVTMEDGAVSEVPRDRDFMGWCRMKIPAEWRDPATNERTSCWPHMWPASDAQRTALDVPNHLTLDDLIEVLGPAIYASEFLGEPGMLGSAFFPPLTKEAHGWWLSSLDEHVEVAPHRSKARIHWFEKSVERSMPLDEFCSTALIFSVLDTSWTDTKHSDRKVSLVVGWLEGTLFALDLWSEQCRQSRLVDRALGMAAAWNAVSINPEIVGESISLYEDLVAAAYQLSEEGAYCPRIQEYRPGMMKKQAKIALLDIRFYAGRIKLPLWQNGHPSWTRLFQQINGFNPNLGEDSGLSKDDEIDALSMSILVLRETGPNRPLRVLEEPKETPIDKLKRGVMIDKASGVPLLAMAGSLSPQDMGEIWTATEPQQSTKQPSVA